MGASSFSPLPEHYDAISHKRDLALKALRLGDRLLEEAAGVLERKLRCGWIPVSIRAGKRPSRVVSKIERIFQRAVEKGETITFDNALSRIKDFAGGRFLIPYLRDVGDAHQIFCEFIKKKRLAVLDGEAEDYNTNPQPSGYRGLHQGLLVKLDRTTWFPFEVPFLTFLQADWALKEHLVYENPAKYPASLHERLRELSSILHDISVSFDDLRDQIAGIG